MKKKKQNGEDVVKSARIMTVMDCVPGNMASDKREPTVVFLLAYGSELEQPFCITLSDARKLLMRLLIALAAHEDQRARDLLDEFLDEDLPP